MTAQVQTLPWMKSSQAKIDSELSAKYGESQHARIVKGVQQAAEYWRTEDGDAPVFEEFVRENFAGDQQTLDILFGRYEYLLEQLNGHMQEINREFRQQSDLDLGKVYPFDEMFAAYSPNAHVIDDFFQNKLAFVVLLNFPLTTLDERLTQGERWTRRQWAEARLALQFSRRVPADVNQAISAAGTDAEQYTIFTCITSSTPKGTVSSPPECGCFRTGISGTKLKRIMPTQQTDLPNSVRSYR
jgi:hypothetical protein